MGTAFSQRLTTCWKARLVKRRTVFALMVVPVLSPRVGHQISTGPDGAMAKSSANGLAHTQSIFLCPMGRCKATTPSTNSLTSNRVTTNFLS